MYLLFTHLLIYSLVGTKALILEETNENNEVVEVERDSNSIKNGMNDEAQIKVNMIKDEKIKKFVDAITQGIVVNKYSRIGKLRKITLKYFFNEANQERLEWKSTFGFSKIFSLEKLLMISTICSASLSKTTSSSNIAAIVPVGRKSVGGTYHAAVSRDSITTFSQVGVEQVIDKDNIPFIRLVNSKRSMDIQFSSAEETDLMVHWMNKILLE